MRNFSGLAYLRRRDALRQLTALAGAGWVGTVSALAFAEKAVNATGQADPRLAAYDELMQQFLTEQKPPGAALAVAKNGKLVYARGFGWADREQRTLVEPTSLFRIASISKPICAAAIFKLIESQKLKLDDRVLDILRLPPDQPAGTQRDERWAKITVRHCLQHTAGWDRGKSFDPMSAATARTVSQKLNVPLPVKPEHILRYMLGQPLDFEPGTRHAYSNFGYCVLGRVIETLSGHAYAKFVAEQVLAPLGIRRMRLAKNLLADRAPGEVKYYDGRERTGPAISGPHIGEMVPLPYGGESLESMDANGGWLASAVDLVRFGTAFDDVTKCPILSEQRVREMFAPPPGDIGHQPDGRPKDVYYACGWQVRPVDPVKGRWTKWHLGLLGGSSTLLVARGDGLVWSALFNSDGPRDGKPFATTIDPLLHRPANQIKEWPPHDLFPTLLRSKD